MVNNTKQKDGRIMSAMYASEHCSELGFPIESEVEDGVADFDAALMKYSPVTLFDCLSKDLGWSRQKIQYVEAIAEFRFGLMFHLMFMCMVWSVFGNMQNHRRGYVHASQMLR